jgi:6-phosphofructokinase 1
MSEAYDFTVERLGKPSITTPIRYSQVLGDDIANYVRDEDAIIYNIEATKDGVTKELSGSDLLEKAGPREQIYFQPSHVHAGIVTCGGLCPGLNDVTRAIVRCLWYRYGVRRITGIQYGYQGFLPANNLPTKSLDIDVVDDIHRIGGTTLGSSRGGGERTSDIVDAMERMNLNVLFTIGGDGTQKGALAIAQEVERRGLKIAVVGIPKTIDNDLSFIQKSFGFETAVAEAVHAVTGAHAEAHSARHGIGLVKVMGRASGFIAAHTTLASHDVNFCLIPEVPFELYGENGLLTHLEARLKRRNHAVILVAEGAGQDLLEAEATETDASGNPKLGDIGTYLQEHIRGHFAKRKMETTLKYIDPSYMIRSAVASPTDSLYCARLGYNAAHAAMAGKTKVLISLINNTFVHLPIRPAVATRNHVDPESALWRDVIEATHQPVLMTNA